jgi:soluble lytic murein transglycosylase-like protein
MFKQLKKCPALICKKVSGLCLGLLLLSFGSLYADPTLNVLAVTKSEVIEGYIVSRFSSVGSENAHVISQALVKECDLMGVDPILIAALISVESRFNPMATSRSGAKGLGQLMPSTGRRFGATDLYDIPQNIQGTVGYIHYLMKLWGRADNPRQLVIASYFRGEGYVSKHRHQLNALTLSYVAKVERRYEDILRFQDGLSF